MNAQEEGPHRHGFDRLGRVSFPVSCSKEAQRRFDHAMAVLHSFWWEEGDTAFNAVLAADSTCAMAHWGIALNAWGNPFAGGPTGPALAKGAQAARQASAMPARTPRGRGFIAATAALYRDAESTPNAARLQAYADTMARLYRSYPRDVEVAIYHGLALVATAPRTDTMFAQQRRAIAIPLEARIPLERGDWAAVAELAAPADTSAPIAAVLRRFTRAIGSARSGRAEAAKVELAALDSLADALQSGPDAYWSRVARIKRDAAAAWAKLAEGDSAGAVALAHAAAETEEVTDKHPATPGELLPARELEADMLLALGRHREACDAYGATLAREPGRARSLFGAARAAELAGDRSGAAVDYRRFPQQMANAAPGRPEVAAARAFAAANR
ncbi:MAG: hypothetical protein ACREOF_10695 [Gemmatimonadales bacterium]